MGLIFIDLVLLMSSGLRDNSISHCQNSFVIMIASGCLPLFLATSSLVATGEVLLCCGPFSSRSIVDQLGGIAGLLY